MFLYMIPQINRLHSRFSPVWLYMCVWSELGRVKRLSHTLHLCFFCVLLADLELNWPIMVCAAGGRPVFTSMPELRGILDGPTLDRLVTDSMSDPVEYSLIESG